MKYNIITVFTSESARWKGKPLYSAVCDYIVSLNIAARCIVTNGIAGCYESGVIAASGIEVLSQNLPCKIEIILPDRQTDFVLSTLCEMVRDGLVAVSDIDVRISRISQNFMPQNLRVKDIMTPNPVYVNAASSAADVVRLLVRADFKGIPVVDMDNKPVGIVTQRDLVKRAGLHLRPGLLSGFSWDQLEDIIKPLAWIKVTEIMSSPAACLNENDKISSVVAAMLKKQIKRFPVTDKHNKLVGMFSRIDVFRAYSGTSVCRLGGMSEITGHGPAKFVRDVETTEIETVHPDTSIEEILRILGTGETQRIPVTDMDGKFVGLIADKDLLGLFLSRNVNVWEFIKSKIPFSEAAATRKAQLESMKIRNASDVMKTDIVTVHEDATISEAARIMTDKGLKRLPVVDAHGIFKGMISRDGILRAGAGG